MTAAAILIAVVAFGQLEPPVCKGKIAPSYDPSLDQLPSQRAALEVQMAYDALCPEHNCGSGVIRKNATVGFNAVTFVSGLKDGAATRAKIVYSPDFLNTLSKRFGPGASFGVLAHEVGHHLTAARGWRKSFDASWDEELRADFLAGCALGRAGFPPDELENALKALAASATKTHPDFGKRNPVVRKGYQDCRRVQDAADANHKDQGFGIGTKIRQKSRTVGCWTYFFRLAEDINRLGPVAAPRQRSRSYASEGQCEAERTQRTKARRITSEPCACRS